MAPWAKSEDPPCPNSQYIGTLFRTEPREGPARNFNIAHILSESITVAGYFDVVKTKLTKMFTCVILKF